MRGCRPWMPWEAERSRGEVSGEAQALSHGCRVETGTAGSKGGGAGRRGSSAQGEQGRLRPGRRCGWGCGEVTGVCIGVGRVADGTQWQARHETGRERPGRVQGLAPAIVAINGPGNGCWGAGWGLRIDCIGSEVPSTFPVEMQRRLSVP